MCMQQAVALPKHSSKGYTWLLAHRRAGIEDATVSIKSSDFRSHFEVALLQGVQTATDTVRSRRKAKFPASCPLRRGIERSIHSTVSSTLSTGERTGVHGQPLRICGEQSCKELILTNFAKLHSSGGTREQMQYRKTRPWCDDRSNESEK